MTIAAFIHNQISNIQVSQINNVIKLLDEDHSIPFIARYRKDATQNLDEVAIEQIANLKSTFLEIEKRKDTILKAIQIQNELTPELELKIRSCYVPNDLEDLYLPFKKSKKTKASIARENGLEPLAKIIMAQNQPHIEGILNQYITPEFSTTQKVVEGAQHIIAEWINENISFRNQLRQFLKKEGVLQSKVVKSKKDDEQALKYQNYFDWKENLLKMPSHRLLAILRAHNDGFIKFNIDIDDDVITDKIYRSLLKNPNYSQLIKDAVTDSYKRLLYPAISNEILQECKQKADIKSIDVFAQNLNQLLLEPPLGEKRILALDPGYKSGCKLVCLDEKGDLLHNETIYPHAPQNESQTAIKKIASLVNAYKIDAISIGNGTASRETENLVKRIVFDRTLQVFVVNENGASVYSASKIARAEFPNYDITVRSAVSIGRRLADPLAELVKIDPKAIGVGQYQHDVNQTLLKETLDQVVIRCVNKVGVNINTASAYLLHYVSGIGEKLAEKIITHRTENGAFTSREQLLEVSGLGKKAYQQCAAFIRVTESSNPLDNSAIHPESYAIVNQMAKDLKISVQDLIGNSKAIQQIIPEKYYSKTIGALGIADILTELHKPGLDPRKSVQIFEFDKNIKSINDLTIGTQLVGIVNNITNFGCFVNIGIKESGLIHISQLKEGFVSDVNEVVHLNQHVTVKVVDMDIERKRIQLSMIL